MDPDNPSVQNRPDKRQLSRKSLSDAPAAELGKAVAGTGAGEGVGRGGKEAGRSRRGGEGGLGLNSPDVRAAGRAALVRGRGEARHTWSFARVPARVRPLWRVQSGAGCRRRRCRRCLRFRLAVMCDLAAVTWRGFVTDGGGDSDD